MQLPPDMHPITRIIVRAAHSDWILLAFGVAVIAAMIACIGNMEIPQ